MPAHKAVIKGETYMSRCLVLKVGSCILVCSDNSHRQPIGSQNTLYIEHLECTLVLFPFGKIIRLCLNQ